VKKLAAVALLLAACAQPPAAPPSHDASSGLANPTQPMACDGGSDGGSDVASCACAHLRTLGCPLGQDPNCAAALSLGGRFGASPSCVLAAQTAAALPACNVTCQ
jgi:hypothetical protein